MTPSTRLDLITQLKAFLRKQDWADASLALDEFGVPQLKDFDGTQPFYVQERLQRASSDALVGLARHFKLPSENADTGPQPDREPEFWSPGRFKLFVSHVSAVKKRIGDLAIALESFGISSFVAHETIEPTREWQSEIMLGLHTCDALLAVLTNGFRQSVWTDQEVGFALGRDKLVVAARVGNDPHGFMSKEQGIQARSKSIPTLAEDIFSALISNPRTQARMTDAVVNLFTESWSFAAAKRNIGLLEQCSSLTAAQKSAIRAATKGNSQIADAFGVPTRAKKLLSRL